MRIQSNFAILDVRRGRGALKKRLDAGEKIPVILHAYIVGPWSNDDGVSREFQLEVQSISEPKTQP